MVKRRRVFGQMKEIYEYIWTGGVDFISQKCKSADFFGNIFIWTIKRRFLFLQKKRLLFGQEEIFISTKEKIIIWTR